MSEMSKYCQECETCWQNTERFRTCPKCLVATRLVEVEPDEGWTEQKELANKWDAWHAYLVKRDTSVAQLEALWNLPPAAIR